MNINLIFNTNTCSSRQQVFETLVTLAKSNKQLLLVYREGRRSDDGFVKQPLRVDNLLFERIQFSNEWQVFIDSPNTTQTRLAFKFIYNQLVSLNAINGEMFLVIPFTLIMRYWLNIACSIIGRAISKFLPLDDKNVTSINATGIRSKNNNAHNKRFDDV